MHKWSLPFPNTEELFTRVDMWHVRLEFLFLCLFVYFHPQQLIVASLYFLQPERIIESVSDGRLPWHHIPFTHAGESHGRLERR